MNWAGCPTCNCTTIYIGFCDQYRVLFTTANDCAANASFSSIKSMSSNLSPACFNAFRNGRYRIDTHNSWINACGSIAHHAGDGPRFNCCFIMRSLITITKAAPSEVCDEFPAVTVPPAANTGFNLPNPSTVIVLHECLHLSLTTNSRVFFFCSHPHILLFTVIGTTIIFELPSFQAAAAFMRFVRKTDLALHCDIKLSLRSLSSQTHAGVVSRSFRWRS